MMMAGLVEPSPACRMEGKVANRVSGIRGDREEVARMW
jgi:hypothetical protein